MVEGPLNQYLLQTLLQVKSITTPNIPIVHKVCWTIDDIYHLWLNYSKSTFQIFAHSSNGGQSVLGDVSATGQFEGPQLTTTLLQETMCKRTIRHKIKTRLRQKLKSLQNKLRTPGLNFIITIITDTSVSALPVSYDHWTNITRLYFEKQCNLIISKSLQSS